MNNYNLNDYIWHPVQETFERVRNDEQNYITIEEIVQRLKMITDNIIIIRALHQLINFSYKWVTL
jgi:hypothetical protein